MSSLRSVGEEPLLLLVMSSECQTQTTLQGYEYVQYVKAKP